MLTLLIFIPLALAVPAISWGVYQLYNYANQQKNLSLDIAHLAEIKQKLAKENIVITHTIHHINHALRFFQRANQQLNHLSKLVYQYVQEEKTTHTVPTALYTAINEYSVFHHNTPHQANKPSTESSIEGPQARLEVPQDLQYLREWYQQHNQTVYEHFENSDKETAQQEPSSEHESEESDEEIELESPEALNEAEERPEPQESMEPAEIVEKEPLESAENINEEQELHDEIIESNIENDETVMEETHQHAHTVHAAHTHQHQEIETKENEEAPEVEEAEEIEGVEFEEEDEKSHLHHTKSRHHSAAHTAGSAHAHQLTHLATHQHTNAHEAQHQHANTHSQTHDHLASHAESHTTLSPRPRIGVKKFPLPPKPVKKSLLLSSYLAIAAGSLLTLNVVNVIDSALPNAILGAAALASSAELTRRNSTKQQLLQQQYHNNYAACAQLTAQNKVAMKKEVSLKQELRLAYQKNNQLKKELQSTLSHPDLKDHAELINHPILKPTPMPEILTENEDTSRPDEQYLNQLELRL